MAFPFLTTRGRRRDQTIALASGDASVGRSAIQTAHESLAYQLASCRRLSSSKWGARRGLVTFPYASHARSPAHHSAAIVRINRMTSCEQV